MITFRLGFALVRGAGGQGRLRLALMVLGAAIGSACLAAVLTLPHLLDARAVHVQHRTPYAAAAHHPGVSGADFRVVQSSWGTEELTQVLLALPAGRVPPRLPGGAVAPAAGQLLVSPELAARLRVHPELRHRLPGTIVGTLPDANLAAPDELFAYQGVSPAQLTDGRPLGGFGARFKPAAALDGKTLHTLELMLAVFVMLPLGLFLASCNKLSAATRLRSLAAIRLIGMPARQVRRINAVETACAAAVGSVLGILAYIGVERALSTHGVPGLAWFPADAMPGPFTSALCVLGLPVCAAWISRFGTAAAADSPLEVRRERPPKPPSLWRVLPLAGGLALLSGFWLGARRGHAAGPMSAPLLVAGVLLAGYGVVAVYPIAARALATGAARNPRSTALLLGARRGELEPGSAVRATAGLVFFVFAMGLAHGFFRDWHAAAEPRQPVQQYDFALADAPGLTLPQMRALPGVSGAALLINTRSLPPSMNGGRPQPTAGALVGTCADLARFSATAPRSCVDGVPLVLDSATGLLSQAPPPGATLTFPLREGAFTMKMPDRTVTTTLQPNSPIYGATLLVPPAAVPPRGQPDSEAVVVSAADAGTVQTVLGGLAKAAPAAEPTLEGIDTDGLREAALVRSLYTSGTALGIAVTVLAYLVTALDRALERRRSVTALTLLGVPRRTLRGSQLVQTALFLGSGLVIALFGGAIAGQGYDGYGGLVRGWDWGGVGTALLACTGVVAVAVLGSLPLLVRRIDPALIRRD
ncbi:MULTISPECIES: ABC transporter permease [unclassified Streptomyces]|uniref:ABC transporter permease n=1 Tax=unclassified Streptomyces TaxID=2593676 RepID=UPI002E288093|nr:FtsX-like permease family protein [Streptomyces sp. NBC_00223]